MPAASREQLYKWLTEDHRGVYGFGDYSDHLPKGKRPGRWLPKIQNVNPCVRGYHVVTLPHLVDHLATERAVLYTVEVRGVMIDDDHKLACEQMRLVARVGAVDARVLRLFACDCAEHVLPIFERDQPDDDRPRLAIETTRAWIADPTSANTAAKAAAGVAAGAAAYAAARAAAKAAAWAAAEAAAGAAVRAAAGGAARDAAGDAGDGGAAAWRVGSDAERLWQSKRLLVLAEERGVL